ncbi:MAG: 2-C-methyl-D-erythritol 2,4-cyclodiphosphate synthase [Clostridia bacterium]|nr:2-C-methyl-D-erythritol 2,4-cyclodiphosphate synthase [Clostridia bacterium]
MRVGHGYDVHRLVENRRLVLGGVEIPYELGLLGHSDADVLLHAICDALLGAAGLGDIGRHFPDTEEQFHHIDSRIILRDTVALIENNGFRVGNVDATVIAQRPKLAPYIEEMICRIAEDLKTELSAVNVKATTEEGLGFTGNGEGIAAHAVCLLESIE